MQLLGAPSAVIAALERLKSDLELAAGPNLAGLILYGGLARGRYHRDRSDVNVVVLLRDASAAELRAIAPALQAARRTAGVDPLLLTPAEVPRAAAAFPTKFLDIQKHHVVLAMAGPNPFAQLNLTHEQIRVRTAQELRNLLLRLRYRYIAASGDATMQTRTLAAAARPFALQLGVLLHVAGKDVPEQDRTAAIFDAAANAFGLDREALARLADLRQNSAQGGDPASLYPRVLEAVTRAAAIADGMRDGSG